MEIEEDLNQSSLSKEEVNSFGICVSLIFISIVRQKLKEYTANRLLRFEKRIQVPQMSENSYVGTIYPTR